jgi:hypothetical protein
LEEEREKTELSRGCGRFSDLCRCVFDLESSANRGVRRQECRVLLRFKVFVELAKVCGRGWKGKTFAVRLEQSDFNSRTP